MLNKFAIVAFFASVCSSQSPYFLERIEVKTKNSTYAGLNFGTVDLEIITADFKICEIFGLRNEHENNFVAGHVDVFKEFQLQARKSIFFEYI